MSDTVTKPTLPGMETVPGDKTLSAEQVAQQKIIDEALAKQKAEFEKRLEEEKKAVASAEKAKLYDTIEQSKKLAAEKEAELKKYKDIEATEAEQLEKKRKEALDVAARLEENEKELERIKLRSAEMIKNVEDGYKLELGKRDLQLYKQTKVSAANGRIISEMVVGNTIEEIDASVQLAMQKYESIMAIRDEEVKMIKTNNSVVPGPNGSNIQNSEEVTSGGYHDVLSMSDEDYKKFKDAQLQKFLKT